MTLRQATAASRSTGKPIFAMYGEDYCPACVSLMKRLKSDESLKSYGDAFVVLKIDRKDPDWETFRSRYRVDRPAIPQLYFVAADGRELHTQVGAPRGEGLTRLFDTVLADSGPGLPPAQVQALERLTAAGDSDEGFLRSAVRFADAAGIVRSANRHSRTLSETVHRYDTHVSSVRGQRTKAINRIADDPDDAASRIDAAVWATLSSAHDPAGDAVADQLIAAGVSRDDAAEAATLAGTLVDAASEDRRRSRPALRRLKSAVRTEPAATVDALRRAAAEIGVVLPSGPDAEPEDTNLEDTNLEDTGPEGTNPEDRPGEGFRIWTAAVGGHQTRARHVRHNDTHVQIETADGKRIAVRLDQLSEEDRRWVAAR